MELNDILKKMDEEACEVFSRMVQSAYQQGQVHSQPSPVTMEMMKKMSTDIKNGFEKNSSEHRDIIEKKINPIHDWMVETKGYLRGAGKSISLVWIIILFIFGSIIPTVTSIYFSFKSAKEIQKTVVQEAENNIGINLSSISVKRTGLSN